MDNIRLFLIFALVYTGFLLWQAWQEDYGEQKQITEQQSAEPATDQSVPQVSTVTGVDSALPDTPELTQEAAIASGSKLIQIETDVFHMAIDSRGGTVVSAYLQEYPVSIERQDTKLKLMNTASSDYFIAQSGLLSADKDSAPSHEAIFQSQQDKYVMADGADQLSVDLEWNDPNGLKVIKRYVFTRGSYRIALQHIVSNNSEHPWTGREYRQLQRGEPTDTGNVMMYTYTGGVIYSPEEKYKKYDFEDLAAGELNVDVVDGWIAMIQHYFVVAFVPPRGQIDHFYGKGLDNGRFVIGNYTPAAGVEPGASHTFQGDFYAGPKIQGDLAKIAQGLDLTVDYGWLSMIAQPMYWILSWIHDLVKNWGWTIIIFTILIKLVFFKLSETSYRSMANMRKLTPRIQALKDRYGDDKQRMQQAMMEMYKKDKINPMGGCLPMLVQMPFFIALYWVLMESVELRQAPWMLWIQDLSIKDPYFILPVIMGATMLVQQKLNPAPPDPMQAKMMMALPFVFTAMFAFFPSGLVLYWVMNNALSIGQQYVITKRIEEGTSS